jgi:hypothetical protein
VRVLSVLDVSSWPVYRPEPLGLDEKVWLVDAEGGELWLFKPRVERQGRVQGEDWSEKLASELGHLLGVPCARVELAIRGARRGSISLNLRPPGWEMQSGAVLLSGFLPDYQPGTKDRTGHSLINIHRALSGYAAPPGGGLPADFTAFDAFAGYLVFDAWIANRDRHEENWAVLRWSDASEPDRLAGSFDHASSLGFNLLDTERERRLRTGTIEAWTDKGTAWRFERHVDGTWPTLVALAAEALRMAGPSVRDHWLARLAAADPDVVAALVHRVPEMSELSRTFISEVLAINRRRLLDEC